MNCRSRNSEMNFFRRKFHPTPCSAGAFLLLIATGFFTEGCSAVCQSEPNDNNPSDCNLAEFKSETADNKANLTELGSEKSENKAISVDASSQNRARQALTNSYLQNKSLSEDLQPSKAHLTDLPGNSSAEFVIPLPEESASLTSADREESSSLTSADLLNATQAVRENPGDMAATVAAVISRDEHDDRMDKIVGVAVPFTCVILLAGLLFVTCKLCQRYRSRNNHTGLHQCAMFCDNCLTTRQVFQGSSNPKPKVPSKKFASYSLRSVSSSASSSTTCSSPRNNYQQRSLRSSSDIFIPTTNPNSLRPSCKKLFVLNMESTSPGRKLSPHSSYSLGSSRQSSGGHRAPAGLHSYGRLSSNRSRLLRQTV